MKLAAGLDRAAVMDSLRREGIATAEYVPCIHLQPYMRETLRIRGGTLPGRRGDRGANDGAAVLHQIEPGDQERVVEVLRAAIA